MATCYSVNVESALNSSTIIMHVVDIKHAYYMYFNLNDVNKKFSSSVTAQLHLKSYLV